MCKQTYSFPVKDVASLLVVDEASVLVIISGEYFLM